MKRKIIGFIISTLLIATTISSVTGTQNSATLFLESNAKPIYKNERSTLEVPDKMGLCDEKNQQFKIDNVIIQNSRDVTFYAYCAWIPTGSDLEVGPVKFDPDDPGDITQINETISNDHISGGTWTDDGKWYGCEWGGNGNANIWIIDNETGEMRLVGSYDPTGTGLSFNGLAYDNTSSTMYGCSNNALYTVNLTTGASTWIGSFDLSVVPYMVGIAFDNIGNLYGNELTTDSLYKINTTTGISTIIGPLGVNIEYAQDMAFDINTGILYLSAFTVDPFLEGRLYTCNTTTGFATVVGRFQDGAQITGFAIPFGNGGGPPPQDETPPTTTHITNPPEPNGDNGWYVSAIKVTINATDDDSGVAWTNYTVNDGMSWITHYGPEPFEFIVGEGEHQMLYYSVDKAGNVETLKGPFDLKIDTVVPDKRWSTYYAIGGPVVIAIICFGAVRDGLSGVDRVEFYLNDTFHHKMDLSVWPVGIWCPIFWLHTSPGPDDVCSGFVYDKAGNWKEIKPQTVPNNINDVRFRQR